MNLTAIHAEIAKERFLDLMSSGGLTSKAAVDIATADANAFVRGYRPIAPATEEAAQKGCPACFGSGGKRTDPCKRCDGTGRVAA
jgi:DnaJ-class molecular chaperone